MKGFRDLIGNVWGNCIRKVAQEMGNASLRVVGRHATHQIPFKRCPIVFGSQRSAEH